jgi:uncharacterized membrane protein YeiH
VLNKTDLVTPPTLLPLIAALGDLATFEETFMVSAHTGDGIRRLADALAEVVPLGPWLYPEDDLTDLPDRLLAAETVREQIFMQTHEEVPYGATVETESFKDRKDGSVRIDVTIYVARPGHKAILIGDKGSKIKAIGARARQDLAGLLDRHRPGGSRQGVIPRIKLSGIVLAADLGGTLLFALEGALIAIRAGLDLLGIAVIGFVAALGGGIIRDVLIGATPPAAIRDARYPLVTLIGTSVAILGAPWLHQAPRTPLIALDAAGLSLFAVAGLQKAVVRGVGPVGAVLMGTLTAVGGGMVRDVLLAQVPVILRTDFYATAAIIGCLAILLARRFGLSMQMASVVGGLCCFVARMLGALNGWHLPAFHY